MTQKELEKTMISLFNEKENISVSTFNNIIRIINTHVGEIIGENETPESYVPKMLTETELSLAHQAVQFHARNALRKEQRKKAGL